MLHLNRGGLDDKLRSLGVTHAQGNEAWLNIQKSVWAVVPEKSVKADGGKAPAVAGDTAWKVSDALIAVARKRMSA